MSNSTRETKLDIVTLDRLKANGPTYAERLRRGGHDVVLADLLEAEIKALPTAAAVQAMVETLRALRERLVDLPSLDYTDSSMLQLHLERIDIALAPFLQKETA